jgi:hypothetical protein
MKLYAPSDYMIDVEDESTHVSKSELYVAVEDLPRWIPVSERLPETRTNVLAYDGNFPHSVTSFRVVSLSIHGSQWFDQHTDEEHPVNAFTHWQPLPKPPEVK